MRSSKYHTAKRAQLQVEHQRPVLVTMNSILHGSVQNGVAQRAGEFDVTRRVAKPRNVLDVIGVETARHAFENGVVQLGPALRVKIEMIQVIHDIFELLLADGT